MTITIKTKKEIEILSEGGKILADILKKVGEKATVGVTTKELDEMAEKLILEAGGIPSFKGYGSPDPFPATLCTSINEAIVHSIPSDRKLKDGDIIGLDIGMKWPAKGGLFTDHAITVAIGSVSEKNLELMKVTKGCLNKAISELKPGMYVNDIGRIIEKYVKERGKYGIVRDLTGHGVGYKVHEAPQIVNYALSEKGEKVEVGMVFAIEPMLNLGTHEIKVDVNGWDIVTKDGSISAHFEHTVVITEKGCRVITEI
ncbi:type I methionyl aminopeptidase [bacterium]|nr:type I methionyl aminopeptidase [bacterium]